ncbi:hypothetical protein CC99x_010360 [Candidatus Berkiella cookevillensis]|uniref:Uncharacterized protein n=1 Tax=Candidatus Berkiella cookevillensis TaxID=437022 RepID=A0A0Q9YEJ7_9GAMM|nr:hypothetical protein [Candidatus Berkiella cookevillensis]MCS5709307.1 hypothetical protein [Candidatus Berkiella cookevillensis]
MIGTESLSSNNKLIKSLPFTEKISCEQLIFLTDALLPLIQRPHHDLLRYNIDRNLYLKIIEKLKCVNLTKEKSRQKFILFCKDIYSSLSKNVALCEREENTAQPDHILATIIFTALMDTSLFLCDFDQFMQCTLAKKAFHKALSEVAEELFKHFQIIKEALQQQNVQTTKLSLYNYETFAQPYIQNMSERQLNSLKMQSELQPKVKAAFENFMGTLIQIKLPHIAMTLHTILHIFKSKCFDYDETQKSCHYFAPYFISALGFEKAFHFQSQENDFIGSVALSHQVNFFSFLLCAIFSDKILASAYFNAHTSYSIYDERPFDQLQLELLPELNSLFAPTSHISYFEQQPSRSRTRSKNNHIKIDLTDLTEKMRELTNSDSPKSSGRSGSARKDKK